jgi:hypothetical protein
MLAARVLRHHSLPSRHRRASRGALPRSAQNDLACDFPAAQRARAQHASAATFRWPCCDGRRLAGDEPRQRRRTDGRRWLRQRLLRPGAWRVAAVCPRCTLFGWPGKQAQRLGRACCGALTLHATATTQDAILAAVLSGPPRGGGGELRSSSGSASGEESNEGKLQEKPASRARQGAGKADAAPRSSAGDAAGEEEDAGAAHGDSKNGGKPHLPRPELPVCCARCESMDTKFCYYNNYNVKQPRYFCKVRPARRPASALRCAAPLALYRAFGACRRRGACARERAGALSRGSVRGGGVGGRRGACRAPHPSFRNGRFRSRSSRLHASYFQKEHARTFATLGRVARALRAVGMQVRKEGRN